MDEKIYRINKAGAYFIGHFQTYELKIEFGDPHTCLSIQVPKLNRVIPKLLNELGIDWENGDYLDKYLVGQFVKIGFDNKGVAQYLSAPFDNSEKIFISEDNDVN